MTEAVYKYFNSWLVESLASIDDCGYVTSHISNVIDFKYSKDEIKKISIDILLDLVNSEVYKNNSTRLMALLVVPLICSQSIMLWNENLSIVDQMCDEDPSIYLLDRNNIKLLESIEEYKVPINLSGLEDISFNVYYRCFRNDEAIKNSWEFNRSIYIEHYSDSFLI